MGCCSSNTTHAYLVPKPLSPTSSTSFIRQMSNIREHYTVMKTLGTGHFGSVYLIKDKRCGIERVAKEIIKTLVNENILAKLEIELSLIKSLVIQIQEHPCIVKIFEIIETNTRIYIITEYLSGGVLFERYVEGEQITE